MIEISKIADLIGLKWPTPQAFAHIMTGKPMGMRSGRTTWEILKAIQSIINEGRTRIFVMAGSRSVATFIRDQIKICLSKLNLEGIQVEIWDFNNPGARDMAYKSLSDDHESVYVLRDHTYFSPDNKGGWNGP